MHKRYYYFRIFLYKFNEPKILIILIFQNPLNQLIILINYEELLHTIYDLLHNVISLFSGPLSILTLRPRILPILRELMINFKELLHTRHDLLHNVFIISSGPLRILTLLPRILPNL
jgi:hypothetical protein